MSSIHEVPSNGKHPNSTIITDAMSYIARGFPVVPLHGIIMPGTYGEGPNVQLGHIPGVSRYSITLHKPQCTCDRGPRCSHPGKHPSITKWGKGTLSIDEFMQGLVSGGNIGIVTGSPSSIIVLDIDPDKGGVESLHALPRLPETLQVTTGGGGWHLYFQDPGGMIQNKAGLRPGIDIRGNGGLVVAPPSMHVSGRQYSWDGMDGHSAAIAPMPLWLIEMVSERKAAAPISGLIPVGERHDNCVRLAGSMRRQGATAGEIFAACLVRQERFESPLPEDELRSIADDIEGRYAPAPIGGSSSSWRSRLIPGEKANSYPPNVANTITAFVYAPEWQGRIAHNEFSLRNRLRLAPPWHTGEFSERNWTDNDDIRAAAWFQHQLLHVSPDTVSQAVGVVADMHPFHPLRDYLEALRWDGKPRLYDWLSTYAGCSNTEYHRSVGAFWMISAVARIFTPGCKVDTALILEGAQGTRKSTLLATLAGREYFCDFMGDLGNKDSVLSLCGKWIVELSELTGMTRPELEKVKQFIPCSTDCFRPPYARRNIDVPRQSVFAGSTNKDFYFKDDTGNRRFWPVKCNGRLDVDGIARDRDQLWAEAVVRLRAGEEWHLVSEELIQAAVEQQAERYEGSEWDNLIHPWLADPVQRREESGCPIEPFTSNSESVTSTDILRHCIGKRPETWTPNDSTTIARSLRSAGWERYRAGTRLNREWRYRRVPPCPTVSHRVPLNFSSVGHALAYESIDLIDRVPPCPSDYKHITYARA